MTLRLTSDGSLAGMFFQLLLLLPSFPLDSPEHFQRLPQKRTSIEDQELLQASLRILLDQGVQRRI